MLAERLVVVIILIPIIVGLVTLGGWVYYLFIAFMLGLAAWEYNRLFRQGGYTPSAVVLIGGTVLLVLARAAGQFNGSEIALSLLVMVAMAVHLFHYERGEENAASNFNITLGGLLYLGWLGAYLISLRQLPQGEWWLLTVFPASWLSDGGAYFIGSRIGRHKMMPRVSPKKSWEGYLGGILTATLGTALLGWLWHLRAPIVTPLKGALLGFVLSVLTPLGDLGESMLKRQFGVKDTSNILPGHGGVMDRIDSWLWAAAIGFYIITQF